MKELTEEQFDSISNGWPLDPNSEEEVEWNYEVIDQHFVKHDVTSYEFVFQDPTTGKWYMGNYSCSYNNGLDEYSFPIELTEVEKVEVTTFEWRKVKSN